MDEIKAIETVYKGYRFRSRLEARWAVFFDAIGLEYQYEPEGFQSGNIKYLPDFYFPKEKMFAEVKGTDEALQKDKNKLLWVVQNDYSSTNKGIIILGDIPNPEKVKWGNIPVFSYLFNDGKRVASEYMTFIDFCLYDGSHIITEYHSIIYDLFCHPKESASVFADQEYLPDNVSVTCTWTHDDLKSYEFKKLKEAYTKARQARFEHGESPL